MVVRSPVATSSLSRATGVEATCGPARLSEPRNRLAVEPSFLTSTVTGGAARPSWLVGAFSDARNVVRMR